MHPSRLIPILPASAAFLVAACDGASTGPRGQEEAFDLELRNIIVQSPTEEEFIPEITILVSEGVDVALIRSATVNLPGGEGFVWGDPGFEPTVGGHRGVLRGNPRDAPLPSGTYTVRLGLGHNRPLTFVEDEEIPLLDGPSELASTMDEVFTLLWTAPPQPHDWAVELWRAVGDPPPLELELVHRVAHGTADGAELEVQVDFEPHIEPGGLFAVKLVMEDVRNRREVLLQLELHRVHGHAYHGAPVSGALIGRAMHDAPATTSWTFTVDDRLPLSESGITIGPGGELAYRAARPQDSTGYVPWGLGIPLVVRVPGEPRPWRRGPTIGRDRVWAWTSTPTVTA